jgi:hypothetical protein
MAKAILTPKQEWAKHLRPFGRRKFWKQERKAAQRQIRRTLADNVS